LEQVSQTTASGSPAIPVAGPSGKCLKDGCNLPKQD
jgi:hypothetical protein